MSVTVRSHSVVFVSDRSQICWNYILGIHIARGGYFQKLEMYRTLYVQYILMDSLDQ